MSVNNLLYRLLWFIKPRNNPLTVWKTVIGKTIVLRLKNGKYLRVQVFGILETLYEERYLLECFVFKSKQVEYYFIDELELIHVIGYNKQFRPCSVGGGTDDFKK